MNKFSRFCEVMTSHLMQVLITDNHAIMMYEPMLSAPKLENE